MLTKSINADPSGKKATETDLAISMSCKHHTSPTFFPKRKRKGLHWSKAKSSLESTSMSDAVTLGLFSLFSKVRKKCSRVSYLCIYNTQCCDYFSSTRAFYIHINVVIAYNAKPFSGLLLFLP